MLWSIAVSSLHARGNERLSDWSFSLRRNWNCITISHLILVQLPLLREAVGNSGAYELEAEARTNLSEVFSSIYCRDRKLSFYFFSGLQEKTYKGPQGDVNCEVRGTDLFRLSLHLTGEKNPSCYKVNSNTVQLIWTPLCPRRVTHHEIKTAL